tara:strand:+ start:678 stop:860 length:183 start_codon:yes stop_codon:yes gene_type:complete
MIFANMTIEELETELTEIGDQIGDLYVNEQITDEEYFAAASLLRLEELAISIELSERGVK